MEPCNIILQFFWNHDQIINILREMLLDEALQPYRAKAILCEKCLYHILKSKDIILIFQYFVTDTLNESLQHYRAKAKTYCAKSKALSYYLDFMFSYKLELGRVTLGSEITWENWHSRSAQVHPTIMSMWKCFQKNKYFHTHFLFSFSKMKVMPDAKTEKGLNSCSAWCVFGNVLWSRMQHCITTKVESEKVNEYIIWEFYILNLQTRAAWFSQSLIFYLIPLACLSWMWDKLLFKSEWQR